MDSPLHKYVMATHVFAWFDSWAPASSFSFTVSYASLYSTARSHTVNLICTSFPIFVYSLYVSQRLAEPWDVCLVSVSTLVIL